MASRPRLSERLIAAWHERAIVLKAMSFAKLRMGVIVLLALGLLGAAVGCHHTHGVCDCDLGPIGHEGPPPLLRPVPAQAAPQPVGMAPTPTTAEKTASAAMLEPLEKTVSATVIEPVPELIDTSK